MSSITSVYTQNTENTSIKILWEGDYDYVMVQQSLNNTTYSTLVSNYYDSSYTATGLTANTLYYFKVIPYTASTGLTGTSQITFSTTTYSIELETFTAGTTSINSVPLSWTGYYYKTKIYGKKSTDNSYSLLDTVIGNSSTVITDLDENTTYDFYAVAYNMYDLSSSITTDISATTDYTPYITDFYLENNDATTIDIQWTGKFSFITIQKSTNGGVNYSNEVKLLEYDSSGNTIGTESYYTVEDLTPNTSYSFRLIPYSKNYNVGTMTSGVSGKTTYGLTNFAISEIDVSSVIITWTGLYPTLKLYYVLSDTTTTAATITGSTTSNTTTTHTITDLLPYNTYKIYAKIYDEDDTLVSTTATLSATTNYIGSVYVSTQDIEPTFITYYISTYDATYPYYSKLLLQTGTSTATLADISYITTDITDSGYTTYDVSSLTPNTIYYTRFTPIGLYSVSGTVQTISAETLPIVYNATTYLYVNSENEIELTTTNGLYKTTQIQYSTDATFDTYTTYITTNYYPVVLYDLSSTVSYYFRIIPYNKSNAAGYSSATFFNPVITSFYISDVSTSKITVQLTGKYDHFSVQRAAAATSATFYDVSAQITTTTLDVSYAAAPTTVNYYRIVPYYKHSTATDISGRTSDTIFVPAITAIHLYKIYDTSMTLEWLGIYDKITLQYKYYTDSTYTDLSSITATQTSATTTNQLTISITDISATAAATATDTTSFASNSYDFRIIPYSLGYNTSTWTTGLTSDTIYNAAAVITDASFTNSYTTTLYYTPNFSFARLYYKVSTDTTYSTTYIELATDSSFVKVSQLYSDTSYNFIIVPYNTEDISGAYKTYTYKTKSMFSFIDVSYIATSTSIYFWWNNTNYTYLEIWKSGARIERFTTTDNNYYTTTTTLSPNTYYAYTFISYNSNNGSNESKTYTIYTEADPQLTYVRTTNSIKFSWNSTGYKNITLKNTTLGSETITFDTSTNTYLTASAETILINDVSNTGILLLPNTQYTYYITYTNAYNEREYLTKSVYTAANCHFAAFDISNNGFKLKVGGNYTSFKVYVDNSYVLTSGNVITTPPTPDIFYYPFDAVKQNYTAGYSNGVDLSGAGGTITTATTAVSGSSLYFAATASNEILTFPTFSNSSYSYMTFATWVKCADNSNNACLFDISGKYNSQRIYINTKDETTGKAKLVYNYIADETPYTLSTNFSTINDGSWTHLATVFDSVALKWYVYVDGSMTSSISNIPFPTITSNTISTLGGHANGSNLFKGYVEDLRLYSYKITDTEIKNLATRGSYSQTVGAPDITLSAGTTYSVKLVAATQDLSYSITTAAQNITTSST
jgi:hypothetical protein